MLYTRSGQARCALVNSPSPALRVSGLDENYPDGRTGNLPFIPSAHKNRTFVARTDLFYTVDMGIAREIYDNSAVIFLLKCALFFLCECFQAIKSIFSCFLRKFDHILQFVVKAVYHSFSCTASIPDPPKIKRYAGCVPAYRFFLYIMQPMI